MRPDARSGPQVTNPEGRPTNADSSLAREFKSGLTIADCADQGRGVERARRELEDAGCRPRGSAQRFRAVCPAHESQHGSLTLAVSQGRRGAVLWCHAGCSQAEILAALGLHWGDLFDQDRERTPDWRPRPRRRAAGDPMAELRRVFTRAVEIINLRAATDGYREACPMPSLSVDERIELAIWGERQDADRHYWRTLGRWAALATDETYVRAAHEARAKWFRTGKYEDKPSPEQTCVLVTRAEDLERERSRLGGAA